MRKTLFLILITGLLVLASPQSVRAASDSWWNQAWSAALQLVQNILPETEMDIPGEEEEFTDPREIQQALREIKDQRRELNRLLKQVKKLASAENDINQINNLLAQLQEFESNISGGTNIRDNIQEFRDAQIWQELNKLRAKIEIPKELKLWKRDISKLEKALSQKKYQNLGLDIESAKAKVAETNSVLATVENLYNSEDLEGAMEEFDFVRQDFHPGEIMSVVQRVQEIMNRIKKIKDADIKNQVTDILSEVIENFNEGEYRLARELLDDAFNDLNRLINSAYNIGKKKGYSKEQIFEMGEKIEEKIKDKAQERKEVIEERREERKEKVEQKQLPRQEKQKPIEPRPTTEPAPQLPPTQPPQESTQPPSEPVPAPQPTPTTPAQ